MSYESKQIDIGIITAIQVELEAVLKQLGEYKKESFDNRTYYRGIVHSGNSTCNAVVTMLHGMGNLDSALAASDMIQLWSPSHMLFVGIAGGLDKEEQNFGDIVVSDSIWYYESAKIKADNFLGVRPSVIPATPLLLDRAQNFSDPSWVQNIPNYQNRKLPGRLPKIFYGPIASGEKVIAETSVAKALREMHSKMAAIEMESGGAASATLNRHSADKKSAIFSKNQRNMLIIIQ